MSKDIINEELTSDSFRILTEDEKHIETIVRPSIGYWKDAWQRLKRNKLSFVSLVIILLIVIGAICVPTFAPDSYKYDITNLADQNKNPSLQHLFGTDQLGRDIFVRTFFGARYSLIIGLVAAIINLVIGVLYGSISGFSGGKVDNLMMRIVDILYSIPLTMYVIILMAILNKPGSNGTELGTIILALSISYWIRMARIVRGEVLQLKQQEFVLAAKALGASNVKILFKHLIPNSLGPIIVTMTLLIPSAIFTEAFLSYLGLGLSAPKASLGTLCNDAMARLYTQPYQIVGPAFMICIIILCFNLFGDGLGEALDPKLRS